MFSSFGLVIIYLKMSDRRGFESLYGYIQLLLLLTKVQCILFCPYVSVLFYNYWQTKLDKIKDC